MENQTIEITLSEAIENFKGYEIVFLQNNTTMRYRTTGELPMGETLICQNIATNQYRLLTSISGTSLTFGDGQVIDEYGSAPTTNNANIIPLYVYGIK